MRIAKSRVVNLFIELGCPKAEKWSNEVLEGRVGLICELYGLDKEIDKSYRKFFEKVYTAVQNGVEIIIVDDSEEPVVEPVQRVDTELRLPPYETPVEERERRASKRGKSKNDVQEDQVCAESITEAEASKSLGETLVEPAAAKETVKPVSKRRNKRQDYSKYLSKWGTWIWMPGYAIDEYLLAGGAGTVEEIAVATKRKLVSVQRQLILLLRFGLVIWDENDVFRAATREERIDFIEHGIKEKFRPLGKFIVRKPDFTDVETIPMEGTVDV